MQDVQILYCLWHSCSNAAPRARVSPSEHRVFLLRPCLNAVLHGAETNTVGMVLIHMVGWLVIGNLLRSLMLTEM